MPIQRHGNQRKDSTIMSSLQARLAELRANGSVDITGLTRSPADGGTSPARAPSPADLGEPLVSLG